jgi:hypothetical protein
MKLAKLFPNRNPFSTGPVILPGQDTRISTIRPDAWFGPGQPIQPMAPVGTLPRQWEYTPFQNLEWVPRAEEPVSYDQLYLLSKSHDVTRGAIETVKAQMLRLEPTIRVRPLPGETSKDRKARELSNPNVARISKFFEQPAPGVYWEQWVNKIFEDNLVGDCACVWMERHASRKGNKVVAAHPIDGATIVRYIDESGFAPRPPNPGYAQVAYGGILTNFTTDDLFYSMSNPQNRSNYGFSPLEAILVTVNIAIRRQISQLAYFTAGSIPDAIVTLPSSWTPNQIEEYSKNWNALLSGQLERRREVYFVPSFSGDKASAIFPKDPPLKDDFDEWLAKVICWVFSISPQGLIKAMNRSSAQNQAETADEEGLLPRMNWFTRFCNVIANEYLDAPDVEMAFSQQREPDQLKQAQTLKIYVDGAILRINEVREHLGYDPDPNPQADQLNALTPQGMIPLGETSISFMAPQQITDGSSPSPNPKPDDVDRDKIPDDAHVGRPKLLAGGNLRGVA